MDMQHAEAAWTLRVRVPDPPHRSPRPAPHRQAPAAALQRCEAARRRAQKVGLVSHHQGGQGGQAGRVRCQLLLQQAQLLHRLAPAAACRQGGGGEGGRQWAGPLGALAERGSCRGGAWGCHGLV